MDRDNNIVGTSRKAAKLGVTMVALSRILMAVPSCGKACFKLYVWAIVAVDAV